MTARENELRVLVVAPTGRDGPLICNLLAGNGISCASLSTSEMARTELNAGAGAIILAEEILTLPDIAAWAAQISEQPSWSDLPLLLLTMAGAVSAAEPEERTGSATSRESGVARTARSP